MSLTWKFSPFGELSAKELYEILRLRQQVFIVEQQCVYQDCDGQDLDAHHLRGYHKVANEDKPVAYLRIIFPSAGKNFSSIGRVVIHPDFRGKGLARELMSHALKVIEEINPKQDISISAQQYLVKFYQSLNFHLSSDGYMEDGIPHIQMIRSAT